MPLNDGPSPVISRLAAAEIAEIADKVFPDRPYLAGKIDANDKIAVCGDGEASDGIIQFAVAAGKTASIVTDGYPLARLGADGIEFGDLLAADANGKFIVAVATKEVLCESQGAGDTDDVIRVKWLRKAQFTQV